MKLGTLTRGREIKANAVMRVLLRLEIPYLEQYLYTKLDTPTTGGKELGYSE